MKFDKNFDPFKDLVLDEEEQLLEDSLNKAIEKDELKHSPNFEETKAMFEEAARNYLELNKSKPVTLRIKQMDLIKVKARAKRKNIPYQTLLGTLIHQFVEGDVKLSL